MVVMMSRQTKLVYTRAKEKKMHSQGLLLQASLFVVTAHMKIDDLVCDACVSHLGLWAPSQSRHAASLCDGLWQIKKKIGNKKRLSSTAAILAVQ